MTTLYCSRSDKIDKSTRTSDIVTLFIGMYGSKEKFIKEYQVICVFVAMFVIPKCTDKDIYKKTVELMLKRIVMVVLKDTSKL